MYFTYLCFALKHTKTKWNARGYFFRKQMHLVRFIKYLMLTSKKKVKSMGGSKSMSQLAKV